MQSPAEGTLVGATLGGRLGRLLGTSEGALEIVGLDEGDSDGDVVGTAEGKVLGANDGDVLGISEGEMLGCRLGPKLGCCSYVRKYSHAIPRSPRWLFSPRWMGR